MYIHILDHHGEVQSVLNTRRKLSNFELADLLYTPHNPAYIKDRASGRASPEEFKGVGVLSTFKDLNKIPRFSTTGQIKTEHIPVQIRGQQLLDFLNNMTKKTSPINKAENLTSWTESTRPIKPQSATTEQISWAASLRLQGVTFRKVAELVGIPFGSLQKLLIARA